MNDLQKAAEKIRDLSNLPWVRANERWAQHGLVKSDVQFVYDRTSFKEWVFDIKLGFTYLFRGITGKKWSYSDSDKGYFARMRENFGMAMFCFFESNALDRPDARVTGTSTYSLWIEEARHVALWSPVVALAVADWLEASDPNNEYAQKVAAIILSNNFHMEMNHGEGCVELAVADWLEDSDPDDEYAQKVASTIILNYQMKKNHDEE